MSCLDVSGQNKESHNPRALSVNYAVSASVCSGLFYAVGWSVLPLTPFNSFISDLEEVRKCILVITVNDNKLGGGAVLHP